MVQPQAPGFTTPEALAAYVTSSFTSLRNDILQTNVILSSENGALKKQMKSMQYEIDLLKANVNSCQIDAKSLGKRLETQEEAIDGVHKVLDEEIKAREVLHDNFFEEKDLTAWRIVALNTSAQKLRERVDYKTGVTQSDPMIIRDLKKKISALEAQLETSESETTRLSLELAKRLTVVERERAAERSPSPVYRAGKVDDLTAPSCFTN